MCLKFLEIAKEISPKDMNGQTPYHAAAANGFVEICEKIIESVRCKDKNPKDIFGRTPLHLAAENGRVGVFRLILRTVEEKNPKDNYGKIPIDYADGHRNILRIFHQFSSA